MIVSMLRTATKIFFYNDCNGHLELSNKESLEYKVRRDIYAHKNYNDFHKIIIFVVSPTEENLPLFYVQYYFDGVEHEIDFTPPCHGNNTKKDKPRKVMFASVREEARLLSFKGMKGKQFFEELSTKAAGFLGARILPNSINQIYDL